MEEGQRSHGQDSMGSARSMQPLQEKFDYVKSFFAAEIHENSVMDYDTRDLVSWKTLAQVKDTIWSSVALWNIVKRLTVVAFIVAFLMVLQPEPEAVVNLNFVQLADTLKVFVTFLLSFFMSSSIKRWSSCVDGFLILFNSTRNMNMQFHALGVNDTDRKHCARFGVISALFLEHELKLRGIKDPIQKDKARNDIVHDLRQSTEITDGEAETLLKVSDRAGLVWIWVASLLGRLAQDGDIPPMASPTYGRMIVLAQVANDGIRKVRVSVAVQSPFVYVHTLAFLVHINNIFCAIAFGCCLGTGIASLLAKNDIHVWGKPQSLTPKRPEDVGTVNDDLQAICMSFITCMVFPVLLQAFLQISLLLAQPFDSVSAIPTQALIRQLRKDLSDQDIVANEPTSWEKPCFKKK